MSACEKCWADAYVRMQLSGDPEKTQSDYYRELLEERKSAPCTPEQQAGQVEEPRGGK